ncbi:MAG: aldose 1-epimerase, partial [Pararhizobium sp.]
MAENAQPASRDARAAAVRAGPAGLTLHASAIDVRVSAAGGAILSAERAGVPFLRSYAGPAGAAFDARNAASFPLVPFGNRLERNGFSLNGLSYRLEPNTPDDPLYLHGDGWLADWQVLAQSEEKVLLGLDFASAGSPYVYRARQTIAVDPGGLTIDLHVENGATVALPFGLGHHLFLPLTPRTTLAAPADAFWSERSCHLPDRRERRPVELDFDAPRGLPGRWVNNGFDGWTGQARVVWPETDLSLEIEADAPFDRYFLFLPNGAYGDAGDYFCFEPMTHAANGHHLPDLGGLRLLEPGDGMAARLRLTVGRSTDG